MHYFLVNPEFFFFVIFINYVNPESPRTFHTHIIRTSYAYIVFLGIGIIAQGIIAAFKCYYRKLIILDMLNQIEEKKYEQIKTKQSSNVIHL
jgi:hypothetical protein